MRRTAIAALPLLLAAASAGAHEGWGIVVHDRLGVVFTDVARDVVWQVRDGRVQPLLQGVHSHALVLGGDGALYGAHADTSGLVRGAWRLGPDGQLRDIVPTTSDSPLGFQSFLIARDGSVYSANRYDHRRPSIVLLKRDPAGSVAAVAGGAKGFADGRGEAARFSAIDGMAEWPGRGILVADGARLRRVTPDGEVKTIAGPLTRARMGEDLLGLSPVSGSTVYVADHAGRRVLRVDVTTGRAVEVVRSPFWWSPTGVAVSGDALYVLEHIRPPFSIMADLGVGRYLQVRRITPAGKGETVAVISGRGSARAATGGMLTLVLLTWAGVRVRRRFASP